MELVAEKDREGGGGYDDGNIAADDGGDGDRIVLLRRNCLVAGFEARRHRVACRGAAMFVFSCLWSVTRGELIAVIIITIAKVSQPSRWGRSSWGKINGDWEVGATDKGRPLSCRGRPRTAVRTGCEVRKERTLYIMVHGRYEAVVVSSPRSASLAWCIAWVKDLIHMRA